MNRGAIFIDIEGTSEIYAREESRFYSGFDGLVGAVLAIGSKVYPEPPSRLFAHQVGGDGIVIVSEFEEESADRFVSLAVVLMQVLLVHGMVGKAGISRGTFGNIQGCIPSLREAPKASGAAYRLGAGLFTTLQVMGTALVNSHRFAQIPPRGGRLVVDPAFVMRQPVGVIVSQFSGPTVIDWVHSKTATMEHIIQEAGLDLPQSSDLERKLVAYVASAGPLAESEWGRQTLAMNNCAGS